MIYFGAAFTILGTVALKYIETQILLFSMAVFFILLSLLTLLGLKYQMKQSKINVKVAGAICGFLTGCISVSGPPLALFLNAVKVDNQQFREIFAWFNILTTTLALFGFLMLDLLTSAIFILTLKFIPILYLGTLVGKRLNKYIPANLFKNIAVTMSLVSSVLLLWKLI